MILETIAKETVERVRIEKERISYVDMRRMAESMQKKVFLFEDVLQGEGSHFICEVKKASPSKGVIATEFPYTTIAKEYEEAGAACISVLTEPNHFLGSDSYLSEIANIVQIPILRKDFTIDAYQIYQAKAIGADCVLLIVALLSKEKLKEYLHLCDSIGLSAIVEVHDELEVWVALHAGARIIGINNRNLKNFNMDPFNSIRLKKHIPDTVICIAESGISCRDDIRRYEDAGIYNFLIGETLMKSRNKQEKLKELKGIVDKN